MKRLSLTQWCQVYLLLALLVATILSPIPYSPLALGLLAVMLLVTFRPIPPRLNIAFMMATIFLLPLIIEPLMSYLFHTTPLPLLILQFLAATVILPAIYLLDNALRQNAQDIAPADNIMRRGITHVAKSVAISILLLLLISLIIDRGILFFTSLILALYWLITLARTLQAIPKQPLDIPTVEKRIITGTTANISLHAASRASVRLHCHLNPLDPWVNCTPQSFTLDRAKIELNLAITPPLAGPSHVQLQVSAIDPRGLIQVNQIAQPLKLHVIPRARYAEWLATKYLSQAGTLTTATATIPLEDSLIPKRGIEYLSSRTFQFGDQLSDIDWKHTLKLKRLIIKEYTESSKRAAIIAVNLSVTDAEEADKLAFNLITTALTLARQSIPSALAAYNHEKVILTTAVTNPDEILKQTLMLVKNINLVEFTYRCLQPASMSRLRRNIVLLKRATSEPAQRLLSMLDFEYQAIEQAAKTHAATVALSQVVKRISSPAIIVLVSQMSHDDEALLVATDKLTQRGFTTLRIEEGAKPLA